MPSLHPLLSQCDPAGRRPVKTGDQQIIIVARSAPQIPHCTGGGIRSDGGSSARSGRAKQRSLLCPLSERRWRHPLLFAVLDLLVLLDQAKSTRNSVRRKTSDRFFGKYPAPSIRRFPARSRFTTFLLHNTVYEFAARTYYPRRISKSGSDTPLTLHYGIALSVIITAYIPMNRL